MSIPQLRPSPSLLSLHDVHSHRHHNHNQGHGRSYHQSSHSDPSSDAAYTALPKIFFYSSTLLALNHSQHVGIDVIVLVGGVWVVAALGVIRRTKGKLSEDLDVSRAGKEDSP